MADGFPVKLTKVAIMMKSTTSLILVVILWAASIGLCAAEDTCSCLASTEPFGPRDRPLMESDFDDETRGFGSIQASSGDTSTKLQTSAVIGTYSKSCYDASFNQGLCDQQTQVFDGIFQRLLESKPFPDSPDSETCPCWVGPEEVNDKLLANPSYNLYGSGTISTGQAGIDVERYVV